MSDKKVRMATPEIPGQGHTIVGGRPRGKTDLGDGVPRGLEVVLKKAAVDREFQKKLLEHRLNTVNELGVALSPEEESMLKTIPEAQLKLIIAKTRVPPQQKSVFLGTSAAAMAALITQLTFSPVAARAETPPDSPTRLAQSGPGDQWEGGHRPDEPMISTGISPDIPPNAFSMPPGGARPDLPEAVPEPVEFRKLSFSTAQREILNKSVKAEVAGLAFLDAVRALADEAGLSIEVEAPDGFNVNWNVRNDVSGKNLEDALGSLCGDKTGSGAAVSIDFEKNDRVIILRLENTGSEIEINPEDRMTRGIRPDFPGEMTRGIRPDFPGEMSKGSRPDFPEGSGKNGSE